MKLRRSKAIRWIGIGLLLLALGIGTLTLWNEVPSLRGEYTVPHPISPWSVPVHALGLALFFGGLSVLATCLVVVGYCAAQAVARRARELRG